MDDDRVLGRAALRREQPLQRGGIARIGAQAWLECPLQWVRVFGADGRLQDVELRDAGS